MTGDHFAGALMLTGRFGSTRQPGCRSIRRSVYISRMKGPNQAGMPAYVGLPAQSVYLFPGYQGAAASAGSTTRSM
jgi:hypothetical protein